MYLVHMPLSIIQYNLSYNIPYNNYTVIIYNSITLYKSIL